MSDLPYPFSRADEAPYYQVALGNGEYVWVVLAGDYRAVKTAAIKYARTTIDLYADLHPNLTRRQCAQEVRRWVKDLNLGN